MTATRQVVRQRITEALNYRGLYGAWVDEALGVEEPTVDLWESGDLVPTPAQIKRLAALTNFPEGHFYKEWVPMLLENVFICGRDRSRDVDI